MTEEAECMHCKFYCFNAVEDRTYVVNGAPTMSTSGTAHMPELTFNIRGHKWHKAAVDSNVVRHMYVGWLVQAIGVNVCSIPNSCVLTVGCRVWDAPSFNFVQFLSVVIMSSSELTTYIRLMPPVHCLESGSLLHSSYLLYVSPLPG